jgi:AraC family transcriptional regulator
MPLDMPDGPHRPIPPRDEYLARIHRVQDHIERHLGEELRLEDLARMAWFSAFHFHRIYAAITGETIREFVARLRLERAASTLLRFPERSITEIALDAGFGGSAAFARAFRAAYGMTASEFRKTGKPLRKRGEEGRKGAGYVAPVGAAPDGPDAADLRRPDMSGKGKKKADAIAVEELPAFTVAYVRHVGPYAGNAGLFAGLFGRLGQWAGPRGLVRKDTRWLAIYHDDPEITPPEKLRLSACITVPAGTQGERDVSVMEIPAGKCAVARYSLQKHEYAAAWNWLMGEWLPASGYQPDDRPCYEVYLSQPEDPVQVVDIVEPVKAL